MNFSFPLPFRKRWHNETSDQGLVNPKNLFTFAP